VPLTKVDGVQPQEPIQPSAPPPGGPGPATVGGGAAVAPAGKVRNRRLRLWLAMGAGLLALFCLGGAAVFITLYDEATKIDRTTPDQVTSSFLRAYLGNRDDQQASLFTCESGPKLDALTRLRDEMVSREKEFGTTVTASWGPLTVSGSAADRKTVAVTVTVAGWADGQSVSSRDESWTFDLVDQEGWRVCGATKVG
jgi:hypothetical protein